MYIRLKLGINCSFPFFYPHPTNLWFSHWMCQIYEKLLMLSHLRLYFGSRSVYLVCYSFSSFSEIRHHFLPCYHFGFLVLVPCVRLLEPRLRHLYCLAISKAFLLDLNFRFGCYFHYFFQIYHHDLYHQLRDSQSLQLNSDFLLYEQLI